MPSTRVEDLAWKTLQAQQRVTVDVTLPDGRHDRRTLRAVIAIQRPDRFRLRALGPGGITLFDLVAVAGRVKVLEAIRDSSSLGEIIQSMTGDLQTAYRLTPRPPDGEREVKRAPGRIEIENRARHYHVTVESSDERRDEPLDPALFSE
jgi:hypothetical protein